MLASIRHKIGTRQKQAHCNQSLTGRCQCSSVFQLLFALSRFSFRIVILSLACDALVVARLRVLYP